MNYDFFLCDANLAVVALRRQNNKTI